MLGGEVWTRRRDTRVVAQRISLSPTAPWRASHRRRGYLVIVNTEPLLSAVALLQQGIERPRRLAFAALRPAGFGRRRPGVDVEMQPALGGGHEAFEEQRADDRAGHAAGRDVVHVGHLGIDVLVITLP